MCCNGVVYDLGELLLLYKEVYLQVKYGLGVCSVNKSQILGNALVEDKPSHGAVYDLGYGLAPNSLGHSHLDRRMEGHNALVVCHDSLVHITEYLALALFSLFLQCEVVGAQDHIL